jgi:hypothetical protein
MSNYFKCTADSPFTDLEVMFNSKLFFPSPCEEPSKLSSSGFPMIHCRG